MYKSLNEIVAELEKKYSGHELLYDLDQRSRVIENFESTIVYIFDRLKHYGEDVEYVYHNKLDSKIIDRLTLNTTLLMQHFCECLSDYEYAIDLYPMDEMHEKNKDMLKVFRFTRTNINELFKYLNKTVYLGASLPDEGEVMERAYYDFDEYRKGFFVSKSGFCKINQKEVEKMNGQELMMVLGRLMLLFEVILIRLESRSVMFEENKMETIYERNYLLYAKKYWPKEESNFRKHVIDHRLRGKISVSALENLRNEAMREFEYHTESGKIWSYYSDNKSQMAIQMRERKLDEEQWLLFFRRIFEIEEYDRWIEELKNPPESDEDKEKRKILLCTNSIFDIQKIQEKGFDILRLYKFIKEHFINDDMKVYFWYALRRFLEKLDILLECTNVDFMDQMNKSEWFKDAPKQCSDNEMNNYNFLNDKHSSLWLTTDIPGGSRVTKSGLRNIYNVYSDLELNEDDLKR